MKKTNLILALFFFLWAVFVLAAFFITQKPVAIQAAKGLVSLAWIILLTIAIVAASAGLGKSLLAGFSTGIENLLLGIGLGLGATGLVGFGLAVFGWARWPVLLAILVIWLTWQARRGALRAVWTDFSLLVAELRPSSLSVPRWMPIVALTALVLTFLLAIAPPTDGWDALIYHLVVPQTWLKDGGLRLFDMPHYWFPSLVEGVFVWPLGFGSDVPAQLLHLVFGLLTMLLVWFWTHSLWGERLGWWALTLLLTMPGLFWLATWAYTDLALAFYALATLYTLWKWSEVVDLRWLVVAGTLSGLAMGVKYTSFIVPLVAELFILLQPGSFRAKLTNGLRFGLIALLVAAPWYLRNWVWMHNPFYPFIFGGPFWDTWRANWFAASDTGIGWNLKELILLPLNITLGHREAHSLIDGRLGPFFLLLSPAMLIVFWQARIEPVVRRRQALALIGLFALASGLFWVYGVINTSNLWQARLLLPGLIPLAMPLALAVERLRALDTHQLRPSVFFSLLVALFLGLNLLDFGLFTVVRNPLQSALGLETRSAYRQRIQPNYEFMLELVNLTPAEASIYFLFEPRVYGVERKVQPDTINDNLLHDLFLYNNAESVLRAWQEKGYTHIMLSRNGQKAVRDTSPNVPAAVWEEADRLEQLLVIEAISPNGDVILLAIPGK